MRALFRLFNFVARAAVKHVGNLVGFGFAGDLLVDVWDGWSKDSQEQERRAELQEMAQASPAEVRAEVDRAVREEADGLPSAQREQVAAYLHQLPSMVRRSLRRPADPTGRTVPPYLSLQKADD